MSFPFLIRTKTQEKERWQGLTLDLEMLGLEREELLMNTCLTIQCLPRHPGEADDECGDTPNEAGACDTQRTSPVFRNVYLLINTFPKCIFL